MSPIAHSIIDERKDQIFPVLGPAEVDRLRRFGERTSYAKDASVVRAGDVAPGVMVLLSGEVEVSQGDGFGEREIIFTHGPGSFLGELAQLSARPSLVNAEAKAPSEVLVIRSDRLRDVMVQEAWLGERIMRALILRRVRLLESGASGPILIGRPGEAGLLRLQGFLSSNGQPHRVLEPDGNSCAETLIERFRVDTHHLPIVLCPDGKLLRNPSERDLARCLGLVRAIDATRVYDVAVVGAGPAGLATAVYAASEGLSVIVLDSRAFGGQAGASSRIENYLGFPTGISGMALMARAYNQAQKFGVEVAIPDQVNRLANCCDRPDQYVLNVGDDEAVQARTVVVASGAAYRRLGLPNLMQFEGSSVHYWASPIEARLCGGQDVVLVGAGNSAGQAAVYLAGHVNKVWLLVRGRSLEASMSQYLVERIEAQANIEVLTQTEVTRLEGSEGNLAQICWRTRDGAEMTCAIGHLFLFIGAEPNTNWLTECGVAVDGKGFVCTGRDWGGRSALETSRRGVFAIGDVRSGSTKRVAAAVGEGAQVVAAIHGYLAETGAAAAPIGGVRIL